MKVILVLSILALSLLIVQTKEQTQSQFQKNRLASKLAQFHNNLTQARPWPIHGGHGPVITNFTKNLTHHKMADDESSDELWSWPKFGGHGPVVINATKVSSHLNNADDESENELWTWPNVTKRGPAVVNFTRHLIATPRTDSTVNTNAKLRSKPKFSGHGPVVINHDYKKNADDEFWSWPKFGGHGPVVTNNSIINGTHWPKFGGHGPVVTNLTKNLTHHRMADDEANDELWSWSKFGEHGPVNFTKNLVEALKTDDEFWSWPKFGGHGPVVVNRTHDLTNLKKADDDDELWNWPTFGGHGPVVTNFTKNLIAPKADDEFWGWPNLTNHVSAVTNFTKNLVASDDDELWSWPKFAGVGPVIVKNNTHLPPVEVSKNKTGETPLWQRFGAGPRVMHAENSKRKFLSF